MENFPTIPLVKIGDTLVCVYKDRLDGLYLKSFQVVSLKYCFARSYWLFVLKEHDSINFQYISEKNICPFVDLEVVSISDFSYGEDSFYYKIP